MKALIEITNASFIPANGKHGPRKMEPCVQAPCLGSSAISVFTGSLGCETPRAGRVLYSGLLSWKGILQLRAETLCGSNSGVLETSLRAKGFGTREVRGSGPGHRKPRESLTGYVSVTKDSHSKPTLLFPSYGGVQGKFLRIVRRDGEGQETPSSIF